MVQLKNEIEHLKTEVSSIGIKCDKILKLAAKIAVQEERADSNLTNQGAVPAILVKANTKEELDNLAISKNLVSIALLL